MIWAGFNALVPAVHAVDDVITHLVSLDALSRLVTAPGQVCQHELSPVNTTSKPSYGPIDISTDEVDRSSRQFYYENDDVIYCFCANVL